MALNTQQSYIVHLVGTAAVESEIEEVTNIGGPSGTAATIDATHLRSAGKEYLAGLPDFGELALTINFTGAEEQIRLWDMFVGNADAEPFELRVPSAPGATTYHAWAFNGIVTAYSMSIPKEDKVTANVTLKTTGGLVYTPPA